LRGHTGFESAYGPTGLVAMARNMLNSMLTNVTIKLDEMYMKCSSFCKSQSQGSVMEQTREDISKSNSEAAYWRSKVLLAQKEINVCEINVPRINGELEAAMAECKNRWAFVNRDIKAVMEDLEVMVSSSESARMHSSLQLVPAAKSLQVQTNAKDLASCVSL